MAKKALTLARQLLLAALVGTTCFCLTAGAGLDFDRMQQILISRFGNGPAARFAEWRQMIGEGQKGSEAERLRRVNDFFNRHIAFDDDFSIWGQSDYWATPLEMLGQGRGDCEDFAIAKYFSLINIGVPIAKLRLVYVRALQYGPDGAVQQAHMVLAYYATPNGDPVVLDNLIPEIRPASQRSDLSPIFSFNSAGLWLGTGNQSSKSNLSRWQDLLTRARAEGFQ
ncbi:MAG: transglutaminase-like cysteine peptidase [Bacteroidota bacterium]